MLLEGKDFQEITVYREEALKEVQVGARIKLIMLHSDILKYLHGYLVIKNKKFNLCHMTN